MMLLAVPCAELSCFNRVYAAYTAYTTASELALLHDVIERALG